MFLSKRHDLSELNLSQMFTYFCFKCYYPENLGSDLQSSSNSAFSLLRLSAVSTAQRPDQLVVLHRHQEHL